MVAIWIQLSSAPATPRPLGETQAEAAAEDDVEAEGLQDGFVPGRQRRQGTARFGSGLGEDEGPGIGEAWRQDAMFLVVGLAC